MNLFFMNRIIFHPLRLEIALAIPASKEGKLIFRVNISYTNERQMNIHLSIKVILSVAAHSRFYCTLICWAITFM